MLKQAVLAMLMILSLASASASGGQLPVDLPPVTTYSIIAYDSTTGQFGAAVQSHYFRVADVIWLEAGVGAVATQSLVDFSYGPLGLDMMRLGKSAGEALAGLLASDPKNAVRQVAMIDRNGDIAVHTGDKCIAEAGDLTGTYYSVQANLMRNVTVWGAMAKAYENTEGDLADRMMAALEAAQAEGGDIRGMQSAALKVVTGKPTGQVWRDQLIDIRVDDSPQPLVELRRLLDITRAYQHMDRGDELIADGKFDEANAEYAEAERLDPNNPEIQFWHAVTLVTVNQLDSSLPIFKKVFAADPAWRDLVPRLADVDLLPDSLGVIEKIQAQ
jgi:uncharacterized Ntn-hydrolase superfamily protein